ncbi:acyltransferase [Arsenophonus nasoniae]|uniref:acyltransferase n=1 Tax=Arsenophonus nasoniae TaxID=638 RepID=UPI003879BB7D
MNENFSQSINLMKVIGCFAVILIHSCIFDFKEINNQWWALNFYNSISRFAVPVFIMISGALLINNKYSLKEFLVKRIIRIIPALVFWSLIYIIWIDYDSLSVLSFIRRIISGPVYYHLWYLYAMIGVLLFSPFLSIIFNHSDKTLKSYFLLIWFFIYSLFPILKNFFNLKTNFIDLYELYSFFGLIGWYFLGAFLRDFIINNDNIGNKYGYLIIFLISSFLIMISTFFYSVSLNVISEDSGITSPIFFERNSPLIIVSSVSIFIFLSKISINRNSYIYIIKNISSFSLGIYCLHLIILRELLNEITIYFDNRWLSIPILTIIVFILCIAIVNILSRIRILRLVL